MSLMNAVTSYFWKRDVTSSGKKLAAAQMPLIVESNAHGIGLLSEKPYPTRKSSEVIPSAVSLLQRNFETESYLTAFNKTSQISVEIINIDDYQQKADESLKLENNELVNGRFVLN